jgi:hypothetical protein
LAFDWTAAAATEAVAVLPRGVDEATTPTTSTTESPLESPLEGLNGGEGLVFFFAL